MFDRLIDNGRTVGHLLRFSMRHGIIIPSDWGVFYPIRRSYHYSLWVSDGCKSRERYYVR